MSHGLMGYKISPISAPAAGPFSPKISPEGIPRVPHTQLGPAPAAELPQDRTQSAGRRANFWVATTLQQRALISIAAKNGLRAAREVRCADDSMPSGDRTPKIFRPKGQAQLSSSRENLS
jgi:hypothetical protein